MFEDLQKKASDLLNSDKAKEAVNKAKDFINSDKGKQTLAHAKDKVEDFVEDKTHGKGIFGFGKKD
ncbi:MAG: hypothetical protein NC402_08025 [Prevotella sp.]|nr:hypothetical protein [Prevotella sp.]MCM1075642.1 hypothetical protein [Ruminococcus sp.]